MVQRTLFPLNPVELDICRRKHGGAETSVVADKRVQKEADRTLVLGIIRQLGAHGITLDEMAVRLNRDPNRLSGRFTELRKKGLIRANGETRPTRTQSPARVYVTT